MTSEKRNNWIITILATEGLAIVIALTIFLTNVKSHIETTNRRLDTHEAMIRNKVNKVHFNYVMEVIKERDDRILDKIDKLIYLN